MSISRRKLLKYGAVGSVGLTLSVAGALGLEFYQIVNDPCDIDIDEDREQSLKRSPSRSAKDFYHNAYGFRPYTLIADTNHTDLEIKKFFFSDNNVEYMGNAGVQHVFLERRSERNQFISSLIRGEITSEEFAKKWGKSKWLTEEDAMESNLRLANAIDVMNQYGIQPHAVDDASSLPTELWKLRKQVSDRQMEFLHKNCSESSVFHGKIGMSYWINKYFGYLPQNTEQEDKAYEVTQQHRKDDSTRIESIRTLSKGSSSVVLYGYAHFDDDAQSMHNLLKEESLLIAVFSTRALYLDFWRDNSDRKPDFIHIIEEDTVYQAASISFQDLENGHKNYPSPKI